MLPETIICSLFYITHIAVISPKNQILCPNFHFSMLSLSLDTNELGNNVFLHEKSCWNAEIMACNVTRTDYLFNFLLFRYELWLVKKFRYFIPNSTQVCLAHLQTSLSQETMYFCVSDPAGMPKKLHAMLPKPITLLPYIYDLWFAKKYRCLVTISTPVCLPHLQTSVSPEIMYFCMSDHAGILK